MGRYDEERKNIGLSVQSNEKVTTSSPKSKYADERANLYKTANVVQPTGEILPFTESRFEKLMDAPKLPIANPTIKKATTGGKIPYAETFKEVPKNFSSGNVIGGIGNSLKGAGQMVLQGFQNIGNLPLIASKAIMGKGLDIDPNMTAESYIRDVGGEQGNKLADSTLGKGLINTWGMVVDPTNVFAGGIIDDVAKAAATGTKGVINAAKIGEKASAKVAPYVGNMGNKIENVVKNIEQLPSAEKLALAEKNTSKIELLPPKPQSGKTLEQGAKEFYENAVKKYDDAIETIQNKFGTNELRQNEMPLIKTELGIDLDELINNVSKGESFVNDLPEFANYERSRLAAGVITPQESKYLDDLAAYKTAENNLQDTSVNVKPNMYERAAGTKEFPLTATPNEVTPKASQMAKLVSEGTTPLPVNEFTTSPVTTAVDNTRTFADTSKLPSYVADEVNRRYDIADKLKLVDEIESLSAKGNTKAQVAKLIESKVPKSSDISTSDLVQGVRTKLGIPSMDDKVEFTKWQNNYSSKSVPSAATKAASEGKQYILPSNIEGLQSLVKSMEKQQFNGIKINLQLFAQAKTKLEQMIKDYGMIKPGENPAREVRLPKQTSETERVRQFARTASESGNLTDEMASSISKEVEKGNFSYEPITDKKAIEHAKTTIGQEGLSKAAEKWKAVSNGKHAATKNDIALGEQLLTEYAKDGNTKKVIEMVSEIAIEGTRAGQVVQAMRLLKKMTPEGKLYYFEKYVNKLNSDLIDKVGAKAKKVEISDSMKEKLLNAKTKAEIEDVEFDVIKEIANQVPATWADKWNSWRYLSMLGNPKTHIKNIVGNAIFYPVRQFKNVMGAAMEKAIPQSERTKAILTKKDYKLTDFAIKDFDEVKSTLISGGKTDTNDLIMQNRKIFDNKALEWARNLNSKALDAEDGWFMKSAYVSSMAQFMKSRHLTAEFLETGTKQANTMFEQARKYASSEALRATFREANSAAQFLNKAKNVKVLGTVVEGLFPFKKTPLNIAKRGLEYSPVGLGKGIYDLAVGVKSGNKTAAEAIDQLSQGMTGTMIMGLGAYLSSIGIVNGIMGTTKSDNFDKATGEQAYSLNIGGKSYTIDWMAPSVLPLMVGVELYNQTKNDDKADTSSTLNRLFNGLTSIEDPMFNLTMLKGLSNLFGNGTLSNKLASIPLGYVGQAVPTIAGQVARTVDTTRRSTYASADSAKVLEQFAKKNVAKTPFASKMLEPYIDQWGREQKNNPVENAVENFASPGYLQTKSNDPVDNELDRVYQETADADVLPRSARSSVQYQKKTYNFTSKEYTQFQKLRGQTSRELIEGVMNNDIYKSADDKIKSKYIKRAYDMATDKATEEFLNNRGLK